MATIHSLPTELLSEVFSQFVFDHYIDNPEAFYDLYFFTLVCCAWRDPAQRALFASADFDNDEQAHLWLESRARPRYRTYSLFLGENVGSDYGSVVLGRCPRLVSFGLACHDSLDDGGYGFCVRALTEGLLHFFSESRRPELTDISGIQRLCLVDPHWFPDDSEPLPGGLRHLELYVKDDAERALWANKVRAILISSRDTLESLQLVNFGFADGASAQVVDFFSTEPFPRVRRLVLDNSSGYEFWGEIVASFPSLTSVEIQNGKSPEGFELEPGAPDQDEWNVITAGASATPQLQHLAFTPNERLYGKPTPMSEGALVHLVHIVQHKNLEGLRRLELATVDQATLEQTTGLLLLDECQKRGIIVQCRSGFV